MAAREKQGYLGNLDEKTIPELKELLKRQQKIMLKQQFVARLPDKGAKIKIFIQKLNQLINQRIQDEDNLSKLHTVTFHSEPLSVNPSAFESLHYTNVYVSNTSKENRIRSYTIVSDVSENFNTNNSHTTRKEPGIKKLVTVVDSPKTFSISQRTDKETSIQSAVAMTDVAEVRTNFEMTDKETCAQNDGTMVDIAEDQNSFEMTNEQTTVKNDATLMNISENSSRFEGKNEQTTVKNDATLMNVSENSSSFERTNKQTTTKHDATLMNVSENRSSFERTNKQTTTKHDATLMNVSENSSSFERTDEQITVKNAVSMTDITDDLSKGFQRIAVSTEHAENENASKLTNAYVNSYERVIRKADQKIKRPKFKPSSTLKISNVEDLPDKFKYKSVFKQNQEKKMQTETSTINSEKDFLSTQKDIISMDINSSHSRDVNSSVKIMSGVKVVSGVEVRSSVVEESAVCLPHYNYKAVKMISIEESMKLVEEQRKKQEEIQTRHAADRLATQLHIKMDNYNPEGTDMNYRGDDSSQSDDEPEQIGYESDGSS